ncbi:hypothetical protein Acsp02_72730 [Actinoplanes sp. NBRC 103695]|nr:hypothetical protein Acsp02_72730 [Actinoplanes sp. NBRC 103695]
MLVGVADAGAWSMIVEPNGFFCTEPSVVALSRGGEQVTFYLNENTSPAFTWAREGEVLVEFCPDYAASRTGSTPDALDEIVGELGFGDDLGHERTLALMERLTGVRVTP